MFDRVNTSPIFKLLVANLSKFVSCQNKLLAKSFFQWNFLAFYNLHALVKLFFKALNQDVLQCHLCYSVRCILYLSTRIMNNVTWSIINNVLRKVSAIYRTYNMFVICCNSREAKTCHKCFTYLNLFWRNASMTVMLDSG